MATEPVTSFYGAFLAYAIFLPLAKRPKHLNGEEILRKEILTEGLVGIQQGKNFRIIHEDLMRFLNCRQEYKSVGRRADREDSNNPDLFKKRGCRDRFASRQ